MHGLDIRKNDTGAHVRPMCRMLHSCVNRLSRKRGVSAPSYTAVPLVMMTMMMMMMCVCGVGAADVEVPIFDTSRYQ